MKPKVLIVDDEKDIVEFIKYNLEREGYAVEGAYNGAAAVKKAKKFRPSLIILDVLMPEMDGITACKEIRSLPEFQDTYIMFLTAMGEEFSEIAGFEAGGNDYVHKPIKPRALISRINAVMKRVTQKDENAKVLSFESLTIDPNTRMVTVKGKEINLPKKEFELLHLLASKPERVFTREKILHQVWGDEVFVVNRTIDVHVRKIREKIGQKAIKTLKGVGYTFTRG